MTETHQAESATRAFTLWTRSSWPTGEARCLLHLYGCRDIQPSSEDDSLDRFEARTARAAVDEAVEIGFAHEDDVRIMPCAAVSA